MGHHYELPIFSFLGVLLVLLPLPWHIKARNVATLSLIAWLAVCNFMRGVNAVIWMDNVHIHYRVWCDITAKAFIGMGVALPACSFCITRYLEHVSSARYAVTTAADKRRRQKIDLCFTFGLPIIIMCLHYVVQGHRFDIIEHTGCQPHIYISIPGIIICFVPAIILSLGSIIYAALALHHFAKRRFEFEQHLRDSQSSLNTGRYLRLMGLALTEMGWGESLGLYTLYRNTVLNQVRPWTNWNDVHYNFSRIAIWPQFLIPPGDWARLMLLWWILPATAMLFFLFFGFSEEAIEGYVACFRWFRRTILRQTLPVASTTGSYGKGSLPQFNKTGRQIGDSLAGPDDIDLDFPDLGDDEPTKAPSYDPPAAQHKDVETGSRLSLTLPGGDWDIGDAPELRSDAPDHIIPSRIDTRSSATGHDASRLSSSSDPAAYVSEIRFRRESV